MDTFTTVSCLYRFDDILISIFLKFYIIYLSQVSKSVPTSPSMGRAHIGLPRRPATPMPSALPIYKNQGKPPEDGMKGS